MSRCDPPRLARASAPSPARRLLVACAALALSACASDRLSPGLETTILPARIDYACENGRTLVVERTADAKSATVIAGSLAWTLPRVDGAAQEKYAQGTTALYLDGESAMLESDGRVVAAQCRSTTPLSKAPAMRQYRF